MGASIWPTLADASLGALAGQSVFVPTCLCGAYMPAVALQGGAVLCGDPLPELQGSLEVTVGYLDPQGAPVWVDTAREGQGGRATVLEPPRQTPCER